MIKDTNENSIFAKDSPGVNSDINTVLKIQKIPVQIPKWFSLEPRFDVNLLTQTVNFDEQTSLTDQEIAGGCVVVLTSDGHKGSISHLTVFNDPEQFSIDLAKLLKEKNIPVCLSGGSSSNPQSINLVEKLKEHLQKNGFILSSNDNHMDVLGEYMRQATIMPDGVMIKRIPNSNPNDIGIKFLRFPKNNY